MSLPQVGISCVKLDGSMDLKLRDRMIDTFTRDPNCRVSGDYRNCLGLLTENVSN